MSPNDPPPYPGRERSVSPIDPTHLAVPNEPGMDDAARRSMEDEERELPEGWIRQYDEATEHHFYVDIRASPPRSIWTHPFDDPEYLSSIPDTDPTAAARGQTLNEHSDNRTDYTTTHASSRDDRNAVPHLTDSERREHEQAQRQLEQQRSAHTTTATSHSNTNTKDSDKNLSFGSKLKNKLTGTTKSERDEKKRIEAERERAYQRQMQQEFLKRRAALRKAQADRANDPNIQRYYASTGSRYASPAYPYSRSPYQSGGIYGRRGYGGGYGGGLGYGYGGGLGGPMMLGGLGGLGGGLLLGSAMGGGFGGGFGGGGFGGDCGGGGGGGGGGC